MGSVFDEPFVQLAAGEVSSGVSVVPREVQVLAGCLWITVEGDRQDYWLNAGDSLQVPPGCLVVMEAHRAACLFGMHAGATCIGKLPSVPVRDGGASGGTRMSTTLHLLDLEAMADIDPCFEIFKVLRPHLDRAEFQRRLRIQHDEGFRIVFLRQHGRIVAAAGFRVVNYLAWGRVLYVDDLVTAPDMKRAGLGGCLMDWLIDEGKRLECDALHLDTGYQRHDAHRLYLRKGLQFTCHHAAMELKA